MLNFLTAKMMCFQNENSIVQHEEHVSLPLNVDKLNN